MISIVSTHMMEDEYTKWISVKKDRIPDSNVIVRVKLTNGVETLDFVNEPINKGATISALSCNTLETCNNR